MNHPFEKYQRSEPELFDTLDSYLLVNADIITTGVSTKIASKPADEYTEPHDLYLVPQATPRESTLIVTQPHSLDQTEVTFTDNEPTVTHYVVTAQNQILSKRELSGNNRQTTLDDVKALLTSDSAAETIAAHRATLQQTQRQLSAFSLRHYEHLSAAEIAQRSSHEKALRLPTTSVRSRAGDTPRI